MLDLRLPIVMKLPIGMRVPIGMRLVPKIIEVVDVIIVIIILCHTEYKLCCSRFDCSGDVNNSSVNFVHLHAISYFYFYI